MYAAKLPRANIKGIFVGWHPSYSLRKARVELDEFVPLLGNKWISISFRLIQLIHTAAVSE